jgi:hypothetical protein
MQRNAASFSYPGAKPAHLWKRIPEAVARGYSNLAEIKKDSSLEPIRGHEEFRKLLGVLEGKSKQ